MLKPHTFQPHNTSKYQILAEYIYCSSNDDYYVNTKKVVDGYDTLEEAEEALKTNYVDECEFGFGCQVTEYRYEIKVNEDKG